jgi:hypothetical protein
MMGQQGKMAIINITYIHSIVVFPVWVGDSMGDDYGGFGLSPFPSLPH